MLNDVVLPDGVDPEQLAAGPGRGDELAGGVSANVVDSVQYESVGFRPLANDGKGGPGAIVDIGAVVNCARIESQKLIEAASVQRQFLDLLLADDAGRRGRGRVHQGSSLGHGDLLHDASHL